MQGSADPIANKGEEFVNAFWAAYPRKFVPVVKVLEKMTYSYKGLCIKQKCVYLYEKATDQEFQCSEICLRKSRGGENEFFLDKRIENYGKDKHNHAKERDTVVVFCTSASSAISTLQNNCRNRAA